MAPRSKPRFNVEQTIYAGMDFPKAVYAEYPKKVTTHDGQRVTVRNQRDELAVADLIANPPRPPSELEKEIADLKAQLEEAKKPQAKPIKGGNIDATKDVLPSKEETKPDTASLDKLLAQ